MQNYLMQMHELLDRINYCLHELLYVLGAKWYQSHFLLENRVVLRVGTVINHRFSPDLVRVEFPVNGLVSL